MDEIKQRQLDCTMLAQWLALSTTGAISLANHIGGLQDLADYSVHAEALENAVATAIAYMERIGWGNPAAQASFMHRKEQALERIKKSRGEKDDDIHS